MPTMSRVSRAATLSAVVALAALAAGCGGGTASPTPTLQPRDLAIEALRSTAALESVRVHVEVSFETAGQPDSRYDVTIEGDVAVATRELDLRAQIAPPIFDVDEARIVVVDGAVFSQAGDQDWTTTGGDGADPLAGVPTTAQAAAAVEGALADPATTVTSEGTESCGDATCDRLRAEVPNTVAWQAVVAIAQAGRPGDGSSMAMPDRFPGFVIDLWVEQATHRLRQATNTTVMDGTRLEITIALTDHDVPVTIEPPIPVTPTP